MKYISIFIFCLAISSCLGTRESIIDRQTGEKIAGYHKPARYQIGKTQRNEYPDDYWNQLKKDSLRVMFDFAFPSKKPMPADKIMSVGFFGKYATSKGLKVGDSVQKAINLYGMPKATVMEFGRDEKAKIYLVIPGLFYDNITIHTDSLFTTVLAVGIGTVYDMDEKYIKDKAIPPVYPYIRRSKDKK